jgi:pyruvate carboxylase subunit B
MGKKFIDIMDTTFRDGFQSVFGGRVLMNDFLEAVSSAKEAGINHFEFGGGARFQSLFFYLNENAFDMMDKFRSIVGDEANLQTLARGVNTVMLDTGSADLIDLHAKLFKKHGTTTIRNFDALNDVRNLEYSSSCISKHGLKNEIVVTMMDLPPGCVGAHDVAFYEKTLRDILDAGIIYDSVCFKDASGTSSPRKVYETIKMARKLLPDGTHIRLHTHETAGVSVACYLSALEAGADGIDLACSPVSGGTSQPDILTMLHATKGMNYDLGGLEIEKVLKYQMSLKNALKDYFIPSEATQVSSLIPFSPMPGGALTANTQMMRDNGTLDKFPDAILAMREVVEKGGYGTSVTPVSQFYWQQAYANVVFGKWKQISPGYGKMVLGYFGKTPVTPDEEIMKIASKQLKLEPTTKSPIDIANEDETKSLKYWEDKLKKENIETSEENIFISAACGDKGIEFLKGNAKASVRKLSDMPKETTSNSKESEYTVQVNNESFNVTVSEGHDKSIEIKDIKPLASSNNAPKSGGEVVNATVSGNVFKIVKNPLESVQLDEVVIILESMKMEIEIVSPHSGQVKDILVKEGDIVQEGDALFSIG